MAEQKDMPLADKAGKYLTFALGGEIYGLEILKVQEIIGMMNVTRVPRTPEFIRGVINLRGKVIPVVDLRIKFGLNAQEDTEKTVIIVVQITRASQQVTMGTIVDEVSEVMDIEGEQIEPPPQLGAEVETDFILGMGKIGEKVVMLLDIDKVLTGGEMEMLGKVAQA
jgi:purine-binding chemotaxis protein CheW